MIISLVLSQTYTVFALSTPTVSQQQFGVLLDGMESIVTQLEDIGLSTQDVYDLFQLSPRESSFYQQTTTQSIPYSGSFVTKANVKSMNYLSSTRSYTGNLPNSQTTQKERIENIYGVALQYFNSNYYEGAKTDATDFGNYLTYLYLSHYIDGPGRAPTASDFPYILSTSDVSAYSQFLLNANLSNWANGMAGLASAFYSNFDYFNSLNAVNSVDQIISQGIDDATMAGVNGYNTASALVTVVPLIKNYIIENHAIVASEEELTDDTLAYVESQLSDLSFYEDFDENITNTIASIMISSFISAICNSISLIGIIVSVVPLFVYEYTGLIQTAVLVNLQYSFSARYAYRLGVYLGF